MSLRRLSATGPTMPTLTYETHRVSCELNCPPLALRGQACPPQLFARIDLIADAIM